MHSTEFVIQTIDKLFGSRFGFTTAFQSIVFISLSPFNI